MEQSKQGKHVMKKKMRYYGSIKVVFIFAATLFLGAVAGSVIGSKSPLLNESKIGAPSVVLAAPAPSFNGAVSFESGFAPIISKVVPAVVNISSTKVIDNPQMDAPFFSDPFFRQFFGNQMPQQFNTPSQQRAHALGSGVVVSKDGYILTNNHVVEGADDVEVSLVDKREFKARIVGTDPRTDIAVLKVDADNLPTLTLGDSSNAQVGNFVLAVGDPFGLGQTVTAGIISATGRGDLGIEDYEDFIQTDASINPGNSGGALVDVNSNLIGINTAILTGDGSRGNEGVGFAIPSNMARTVMDQILKNGHVIRGYLGAWIQPVTPEIASAFNLKDNYGALLGDVDPTGPAGKSGLQRGDVVLEMNGQKVNETKDFRLKIAMTPPNTPVHLKVDRNGVVKDYTVTLGELPNKDEETAATKSSSASALQGLSAETLTPEIANQLGLPAGTYGVVVDGVDSSSLAAEAGLRRGDVIQEVNRQKVANMADFSRLVQQSRSDSFLLLVNRGGNTMYVVLKK
jgi:serine protease Do